MPLEFNVDHTQMQVMKGMTESMWGFHYLREEKDDPSLGEIIAEHTDGKGRRWLVRSAHEGLNDAQKDQGRQILTWLASR